MKIGERIKTLRKAKRLTLNDLAVCIGKDRSQVGKYEKGTTDIPLSVLEKIAASLDVPVKRLFE